MLLSSGLEDAQYTACAVYQNFFVSVGHVGEEEERGRYTLGPNPPASTSGRHTREEDTSFTLPTRRSVKARVHCQLLPMYDG